MTDLRVVLQMKFGRRNGLRDSKAEKTDKRKKRKGREGDRNQRGGGGGRVCEGL